MIVARTRARHAFIQPSPANAGEAYRCGNAGVNDARGTAEPSGIPADGAAQERVAEGDETGDLAMVLAVAVPAGGRLVEMRLITHGLQLGGHFSRMSGMDAVVAAAGRQQDRRIG